MRPTPTSKPPTARPAQIGWQIGRLTARLPALLALLLLPALGGCDSEPKTVPFKRDAANKPAPAPAVPETPEVPAAPPGPAVTAYPEGPARIELDGSAITLPEHHVLASLQHEISGDSQDDAVLLVNDGHGGLSLRTYVRRNGGALEAQAPVSVLSEAECEVTGSSLRALSEAHLAIDAQLNCRSAEARAKDAAAAAAPTDSPPPAPPGTPGTPGTPGPQDAPAGTGSVTRVLTVLASLERTPRILQRVEHLRAPGARPDATLTLALEGRDADADGHMDVVAKLSLTAAGLGEALSAELTWLDRAAGLGRDPEAPEKQLAKRADVATQKARRAPAEAEQLAREVRGLHDLLCQGGAHPMLRIDGTAGLPCGRSEARGRASAALVAALVRQKRLTEALAELAALHNSPAQRVADRDRERADAALAAFPGSEAFRLQRGPHVDLALAPPVHAARVRFEGEGRLTLLTTSAQRFDLGSGQLSPVAPPTDWGVLLTSPDGELAATEVIRKCDGYHLRLLQAQQIVAGVAAGQPSAEPLLVPMPPPGGDACSDPLPRGAAVGHGIQILTWGPGGVLFAHGGQLQLLPLGADGRATGPARLASGAGEAALATRTAAGLTGEHIPLPTRLGIALLDLRRGTAELLRTEGASAPVEDLAMSPSGTRLAFVRGGFLWTAVPPGAPAQGTAAPSPAPPPAAPSPAPPPAAPPPNDGAPTAAPGNPAAPAAPPTPTAPAAPAAAGAIEHSPGVAP